MLAIVKLVHNKYMSALVKYMFGMNKVRKVYKSQVFSGSSIPVVNKLAGLYHIEWAFLSNLLFVSLF